MFGTLHKKMKFSIKDFFSKCDQIRSFLRIWSHLLKKSLMENFIFCAVKIMNEDFQFQIENHRNLRNNPTFRIPSVNTIFKKKESVYCLGPKIWSQLSDEIKSLESLTSFKKATKK